MKDKINVAELLKDCPKGMELDCTIFDGVYFDHVNDLGVNKIKCYVNNSNEHFEIALDKYGQYVSYNSAKCVIFPKGKNTWEGFIPPCKFKDGDIITCTNSACSFVSIFKEMNTDTTFKRYVSLTLDEVQQFWTKESWADFKNPRLAIDEEKEKLFQAIKENGYKWNPETKTLDKLIEPKFKVGDTIRRKNSNEEYIITSINDYTYYYRLNEHCTGSLGIQLQDEYELVLDKFDVTTLMPFDKVLVRGDIGQKWIPDFFGFMDKDKGYPFVCVRHYVIQCIPYEGNEHLLGKTDDCDEYFKTWK